MGNGLLTRTVSLRALVAVAVLSAVLAGSVGFATALGITPRALTIFTSADTVPVTTCTLTTAEADAYAYDASPGTNFGTETTLHVRSGISRVLLLTFPDNKRSFVRFDLSSCSVPSSARVVSAEMKLFLSAAPSLSRTYQAHRVTQGWNETNLTWDNQPTVADSPTASATTGTASNVTIGWDVRADVQTFVAGTATNSGWRVKDLTEGAEPAIEGRFNSREHGTATQRPSLVVTYYP
jgi:hypothetical protein